MSYELEKIATFIAKHHVMSLATSVDNRPYSTPLFYAYHEEKNYFIFASDSNTKHMLDIAQNCAVSASIYLETKQISKIEGLQICGVISSADKDAQIEYYKAFNYAKILQPKLYKLLPSMMKLTDNSLGFGKKIIWNIT